MSLDPAELRALADHIESQDCTGIAANWCPVHGDCACPRDPGGRPIVDSWIDSGCPLHSPTSSHAEAYTQRCRTGGPVAAEPAEDATSTTPRRHT